MISQLSFAMGLNLKTSQAAVEAASAERDTRAPVIPRAVARTTIFFAAGRNGIEKLPGEVGKKRLFFFRSATGRRNI